MGAGMAPAAFDFFSFAGASVVGASAADLVELFFTARLRTFFGSSAIRSNPFVMPLRTYAKKSSGGAFIWISRSAPIERSWRPQEREAIRTREVWQKESSSA
jgi:hypothetical protein